MLNRRLASPRWIALSICATLLLASAGGVRAQGPSPMDELGVANAAGGEPVRVVGEGADRLAEGWDRFGDVYFLLDMAIVLLAAIALAAVIAYHPTVRGKASSLAEIEQPKTFIIYSMVGAIVAQIVEVNYSMGLVVFGLGGLMRFRTDVGEAKDTGRVILVTVVGLCCGLKLYPVAVLATGFGWLLITFLESDQAGKLIIRGLEKERLAEADEVYTRLLRRAGCKVVGGRKNVLKGQVSFIFKAPRGLDRDDVEKTFDTVPEELRGATDWEFS